MKKYLPFLLLAGLLVCCAQGDGDNFNQISNINSRFTHDIPNCANAAQFEINCTEFIEFIDDLRVLALLGGGNILMQMHYKQVGDYIIMEGHNLQLIFKVQDESTLLNTSDNATWQKK